MSNIKIITRGAYDIQKLRIQMGNRIVGNFKAKLGQKPSEDEGTMDSDGKLLLGHLRLSYKKITDGVVGLPTQKKFSGDELISSYTELVLIDQYISLEQTEASHFKMLGKVLKEYPVYTEFLEGVCGVGPAMAGVIISEINIHRAQYPSSIWAYAGLDVARDGSGRSRKKEHLVERDYTDKDGKPAKRVGITFNPFLKTKMIGVLGSSFIKQSPEKCIYRKIYDDYKHRLENSPAHEKKTKGHRHNMAVRYMVKQFLVDLHRNWRELEGLPASDEYSVAKLGIVHRVA